MSSNIKDRLISQLESNFGFSQKKEVPVKKVKPLQKHFKATVLVIDDEPSMIAFATTFLEDDGYQVLSANSVVEAKKILQSDLSISLILSDLNMPDEDGFSVLSYIKSNIRFSHIPVIVATAHSDPKFVVKAMEVGAKDYLVKPYTPDALIERVGKIFLDCSTFILLVSNDEIETMLLKRSINNANTNLIRKKNGLEGCEELKNSKFDVIIASLLLDDMTGIDFLGEISEMGIETPLIFIESNDVNISVEIVHAIGAHGFLSKPFNNTEILKVLRSVIRK